MTDLDLTQIKSIKVIFTPEDQKAPAEFFSIINSFTQSLYIADYSFNLAEFDVDLPELQSKGVTLGLVLDKTQEAGKTEKPIVEKLLEAKIPTMIGTSSDAHQIMHDKLIIGDGHIVITGSWNFTNSATKECNNYLVIDSEEVAALYKAEWQRMWTWIKENEPQPVIQ